MNSRTGIDGFRVQPDRLSCDSTALAWPGTARYGLRPAPPGGLALVQDFLNTRAHPEKGPDLLDGGRHARAWAAEAMYSWSMLRGVEWKASGLADADATALRALRDRLDRFLAGEPVGWSDPDPIRGAVTLALGDEFDEGCWWQPRGQGWGWIQSAILAEIVLSRETGTWARMKRCRNSLCGAVFYDSTWNNADTDHGHRASSRSSRAG